MTIAVYFDLDGTCRTYAVSSEEQFATTVSPYGEATEAAYVDRLFAALERCESEPYHRAFEAAAGETEFEATPAALAGVHRETELEASVVSADARRVLERVSKTNPIDVLTDGDGSQQRAKLEPYRSEEVVVSSVGALLDPPSLPSALGTPFEPFGLSESLER